MHFRLMKAHRTAPSVCDADKQQRIVVIIKVLYGGQVASNVVLFQT
jgi:hypothetical protein